MEVPVVPRHPAASLYQYSVLLVSCPASPHRYKGTKPRQVDKYKSSPTPLCSFFHCCVTQSFYHLLLKTTSLLNTYPSKYQSRTRFHATMSTTLFRTLQVARTTSTRNIATATAAAGVAGAAATAATVAKVSAKHQTVLAVGSLGAWAATLGLAPMWAPHMHEKFGERFARMEKGVRNVNIKGRIPHGLRIPIPRVGNVQYVTSLRPIACDYYRC